MYRRNGGGQQARGNNRGQAQERPAGKPPCFSREMWTGSGVISVAVFEKEIEGQSGKVLTYFVTVKRSWKDKDDHFQEGNAFQPHDCLLLADLLTEAHRWMLSQTGE